MNDFESSLPEDFDQDPEKKVTHYPDSIEDRLKDFDMVQLDGLIHQVDETQENINALIEAQFSNEQFDEMFKPIREWGNKFNIPKVLTEFFLLRRYKRDIDGLSTRKYYDYQIEKLSHELEEKDYQFLLEALEDDWPESDRGQTL